MHLKGVAFSLDMSICKVHMSFIALMKSRSFMKVFNVFHVFL